MSRRQTGVLVRRPGFYSNVLSPVHERPGELRPSQPDPISSEQGIYVRLPGVNFPPAGSIPVDEDGDQNIAPGATATLLQIQVPDTYRLRLVGIGFGADDETALRFLTWSLRFNNDTIPGYVVKNAVIGSIVQLTEFIVVAGSSVLFSVQGSANAAAVNTYRYICRVRGYFYTERAGS